MDDGGTMKMRCPFCKEEIEITQSERAKHGYRKFENHKAACFKETCSSGVEALNKVMQECIVPRVPKDDDVYTSQGENITEVIERLHIKLGRIPTEGETMAEMMRIRARNEMKKIMEEQNNVLEAGMGKRDQ